MRVSVSVNRRVKVPCVATFRAAAALNIGHSLGSQHRGIAFLVAPCRSSGYDVTAPARSIRTACSHSSTSITRSGSRNGWGRFQNAAAPKAIFARGVCAGDQFERNAPPARPATRLRPAALNNPCKRVATEAWESSGEVSSARRRVRSSWPLCNWSQRTSRPATRTVGSGKICLHKLARLSHLAPRLRPASRPRIRTPPRASRLSRSHICP
jgi:hypothetical protein